MSCISRKNLPFWNATWEQCGLKWKKGTILGDIIVLLHTYLFKKAKLEMFGKIFPNFSKNVDFNCATTRYYTIFFSNFIALHCICGRKRPIWQNMYFGKFNRRLVTNGDGKMSTLLALSSKKLPDPICKYL